MTMANLFLHSVITIMSTNSARKLKDILKIADGPIHSSPLHSTSRTLRKLADIASSWSIRWKSATCWGRRRWRWLALWIPPLGKDRRFLWLVVVREVVLGHRKCPYSSTWSNSTCPLRSLLPSDIIIKTTQHYPNIYSSSAKRKPIFWIEIEGGS